MILTPAPIASPTPPPVIVHTISSETCTTLQKLILPVGQYAKLNNDNFTGMAAATRAYLGHIMTGDDPNIQRPHAEGSGGFSGAKTAVPSGDSTSSSLSVSTADDPVAFGPDQTIQAATIDRRAQQIYASVSQQRQLLNQSYQEYPAGKNLQLDALRTKTSDMIEAQGALADRYERFAGAYLQNLNGAEIECKYDSSCLNDFKQNLRALILGASVDLGTDPAKPGPASNFGYHDMKDLAKSGTTAEVVGALRYQENAFTASVYDVYNQCHGTHYVLPPSPTSSGGH